MNNFKKIGMTALAASLVSTSVFAGELTASGGASLTVEGYSGTKAQTDTAYSMGDSVILSGSTELDNGMTVTMSYELDGATETTSSPYDDNSLTISSDALGTIKFSAHGGSSASSALDTTAAGDMWDNFDTGLTVTGAATKAAGAGDNSIFYTTPSMVDGLAISASLNTTGTTGNNSLGYSATYSGVEGLSISYGVADISCENEFQFISSFKITNATYTAISMRDGDTYAKQFGSVNDASGIPDGTNGEDFYRVWVYCEDYSGANTDSVEVMLADYRFADSTQDYIVDTWVDVDLQNLSFPVSRIQFKLESSDVGAWGMNTPAYYAIDNVVSFNSLGLVENKLIEISAYPNPVTNALKIEGEKGLLVLTDLNGGVIFSQNHNENSTLDCSNLSKGVYILSVTNSSGRFSEKIVK